MTFSFKNTLSSRRVFLSRAVQGIELAGAIGMITGLGTRRTVAREDVNPWAYDISPYLTTDPALIRYSEDHSFVCPKSNPSCLAVDGQGHLWIAAGTSIIELSMAGKVVSEFLAEQEVRCLAVNEDRLYAAYRDRVAVFNRRGEARALWDSPGPKAYLTGITVHGSDVYLADAGQRIVHRYDLSGRPLNRIGGRDPERGIPGFIVPSPFFAVVAGTDGLLRVTNTGRHRVELYTPEGNLELSWGKAGMAVQHFSGCCNPVDLALLPDGRTVTFEKGIPRVKIYSATGEFECVVAGPESFEENARVCGPNDCTLGGLDGVVGDQGRIVILDFVSARVRVMAPKGEPG
jgi:hypothetical protein